jgi:hypothetical protein
MSHRFKLNYTRISLRASPSGGSMKEEEEEKNKF